MYLLNFITTRRSLRNVQLDADRTVAILLSRFYRAMHVSAQRGLAIACRPSVCLSVTLVDCDHFGNLGN